MDRKEQEEYIVQKYQDDEKMMILIFAQWCVNYDFDPKVIYEEAYPEQMKNDALHEAIELTVPKHEADDIPHEVVLQVLQLFGNDDLAFIVQDKIDKLKRKEEKEHN